MKASQRTYPLYLKLLVALGLLVIAYIFCFHHLDWLSLQHWDETLFAMRAAYLAKTGTILENFDSFPFMNAHSNTKPPLITFIQAFLLKHMDNHLLALRLPSSIAQLFLAFFLVYLGKVAFKNWGIGILGFLIFLTSKGLYVEHIARFGDQDMPFIFFLFVCTGLLFQYLNTQKVKYLVVALLFFLFAYYTKSVLAYVIFPGVLVYILSTRNFDYFKQPINYLFGALFLLPILVSFLFADSHHGNINRLTVALDHYHEWYHYLKLFVADSYLTPWIFFAGIGVLISIFVKHKFLRYLSIQAVIIVAILSLAAMRLHHYIAIVYPVIALLAAYVVHEVSRGFYQQLPSNKPLVRQGILGLSLLMLFAIPAKNSLKYTYKPVEIHDEHLFTSLLDQYHRGEEEVKDITIVTKYLPLSISFYAYWYAWKYAYDIDYSSSFEQSFPLGMNVMYHKEEAPNLLAKYHVEVITETKKIQLCKIVGLR